MLQSSMPRVNSTDSLEYGSTTNVLIVAATTPSTEVALEMRMLNYNFYIETVLWN